MVDNCLSTAEYKKLSWIFSHIENISFFYHKCNLLGHRLSFCWVLLAMKSRLCLNVRLPVYCRLFTIPIGASSCWKAPLYLFLDKTFFRVEIKKCYLFGKFYVLTKWMVPIYIPYISRNECYFNYWKTNDIYIYIFSIWVFFHEHLRITGLQWKGEGIS